MEENPSTENIERFSAAQEQFEAAGGYAAEAEVRKLADGVGLRADRLDLTSARSPAVSGAAPSSCASCSAAATCSSSTSPPTTSTPTPAAGCSSSCGRTAARCSS